MLNKFSSLVVVVALVCTLAGTPAFANTPSEPNAKAGGTTDRPDAVAKMDKGADKAADKAADKVVNEKLRTEIRKLIADTKAARDVVTVPRPQIQPPLRNNLSTGAKIAIGVGIAAVVVTLIFLKKYCDNEGGCN